MKVLGIIPARYESSRFPGKPLAEIQGKPMIQHVYENASKAEHLDRLVVATDDERVAKAVKAFGGEVEMTGNDHHSGTDRCREVSAKFPEYDVVVNIQGDEPFIDPDHIDDVVELFNDVDTQIGTLVKLIADEEELNDPNRPKAKLNEQMFAEDFSRQPFEEEAAFKHIGIYAYEADVLAELTELPPSERELEQRLEQLRFLDNGFTIKAAITTTESPAIDTPEDLQKLLVTLG